MIKRECFHPEEIPSEDPGVKIRMSWGDRIAIAAFVAGIATIAAIILVSPFIIAYDEGDRSGYARGREHGREICR